MTAVHQNNVSTGTSVEFGYLISTKQKINRKSKSKLISWVTMGGVRVDSAALKVCVVAYTGTCTIRQDV